jgi:hypothetical protein
VTSDTGAPEFDPYRTDPMGLSNTCLYAAMANKHGWIKGKVLILFYSSIFVACIAAAIAVPWLYRRLSDAGTSVQRSMRKRKRLKTGPTSHLGMSRTLSVDQKSSETWEMVSQNILPGVQVSRAVVEHGNDNSYFGSRNEYSAPLKPKVRLNSAGWLSRKDERKFGGNTYKVQRRLKVRESNPKHVSKPTGWE